MATRHSCCVQPGMVDVYGSHYTVALPPWLPNNQQQTTQLSQLPQLYHQGNTLPGGSQQTCSQLTGDVHGHCAFNPQPYYPPNMYLYENAMTSSVNNSAASSPRYRSKYTTQLLRQQAYTFWGSPVAGFSGLATTPRQTETVFISENRKVPLALSSSSNPPVMRGAYKIQGRVPATPPQRRSTEDIIKWIQGQNLNTPPMEENGYSQLKKNTLQGNQRKQAPQHMLNTTLNGTTTANGYPAEPHKVDTSFNEMTPPPSPVVNKLRHY